MNSEPIAKRSSEQPPSSGPGPVWAGIDLLLGLVAVVAAAWAIRAASVAVAPPLVRWSSGSGGSAATTIELHADHSLQIGDKSYPSLTALARLDLPWQAPVELKVAPDAATTAVVHVVQWLRSEGVRDVLVSAPSITPSDDATDDR